MIVAPPLRPRLQAPKPIRNTSPTGAIGISSATAKAYRPRLAGAPQQRKLAMPSRAVLAPIKQASAPKKEAEKRPWYIQPLANTLGILRTTGAVIKAAPVIGAKLGQSVVGIAENILDIPTNIIDPDLWRTRQERDFEAAQKAGLGKLDTLVAGTRRSIPILSDFVQSFRTTPPFIAETITGGLVDTGRPGFDLWEAYQRGRAPELLFEHGGNIMLAGRLLRAGNIGVKLGEKISAGTPAVSTRNLMGRAVATTSRWMEEPIGTSVRGAAAGASRAARQYAQRIGRPLTPRIARAVDTLEMMSKSRTPLMTGATRSAEAFRLRVDQNLATIDEQIANLGQERRAAEASGDVERLRKIDVELKRQTSKRESREKMGETVYRARRAQAEKTRLEDARRGYIVGQMIRFDELGAAPEPVEVMLTRATELRDLAERRNQSADKATGQEAARLRSQAEQNLQQASFLERAASVKQANPERLQDTANRTVNFEAANIVNSKLIDQVMVDVEAGLTLPQIMDRIQPPELGPRTIKAGYAYTPQGVQRAIEFVQGTIDEADRLEMDVASALINMFAEEMYRYGNEAGTLVTGVLSPAQFGDIPMPEILIKELDKRKFASRVYELLDEQIALIIREGFDELAETLGDKLDKPEGLYKKYASARPDSDEYMAAYFATARVTENLSNPAVSVFASDPRLAMDVAEFFRNPAIYAARMRPMLAYRESVAMEARAADVNTSLQGLKQLNEETPGILSEKQVESLNKLLEEVDTSPTKQFDTAFYRRTISFLNSIIRDLERRRTATTARQGVVEGRIAESDARLAQVEAQARAAAGMVEQAMLRPEELAPAATPETQALRQQASDLETEAGRLLSQSDPLDTLRKQIGDETDKLETARSDVAEKETEVRDLEQSLATQQKLLDDAALDEEGMVLLLAELDESSRLAQSGIGVDPVLAEQRAWKQQKMDEAQSQMDLWEERFLALSPEYATKIEPGRSGELKATATGGVQEINVRRQGGFQINRAFLDSPDYIEYILRGIPNPTHRRRFYRDHTVRGMRLDPATGIEMPTKGSTIGEVAGRLSEEEFLTQLTEAYTNYMNARDEYARIKGMPFKGKYGEQVKEAMSEDQRAVLDEQPWQNPLTGEEIRGVRPLGELRRIEQIARDQDTLAEQVRLVRAMQKELQTKRASLDNARREAQRQDRRIAELSARVTQMEGSSPRLQAARLTSEAQRMTDEAARLEAENVRLRPAVAKERVILTRESGKRLRAANARRAEGREVTGYEFTKGVAKKLDDAQTAELREQQRLYEESRQLQARLNEQDNALFAGMEIAGGARQYAGTFATPTGRALLQGTERPRLMGETDQPTWMPVGQAANVLPSSRAPKTITTEGMAPEQIASIEQQRQSTFMPMTPGQFASRMTEILNQTSRNRVVSSILTNRLFVTDVETLLTPDGFKKMQEEAENQVLSTGIRRDSSDFEKVVREQLGANIIELLDKRGFEPVWRGEMPDPSNPYAGRASVGDLLGAVNARDIKPNTIVMKKGLRENIAAQYQLVGTEALPPLPARIVKAIQEKTSQWKSVVLPFSTRWQVGDGSGNVINAAVRGGIHPRDMAAMMVQVFRRLNPDSPMNLRTMSENVFGQSIVDPVISVMAGVGLQTSNIKLSELSRMHPKGSLRPSADVGRLGRMFFPRFRERSFNFNETQNGMARSALADFKLQAELDRRGRSINEIDPLTLHNDPVLYEAVVDAVKTANDTLGNFSQLTRTEKQFIRSVYPFWSWIKFINTAAGQLLLTQPDRVLFYTHLGSMVLGDDADEFYGWLNKQIPVPTPFGTFLVDLSFLNPYSDAALLQRNPLVSSADVATGISPIIGMPAAAIGELYYGATGDRLPYLSAASRPGYLEGKPGQTTRTWGDTLGGIGYMNFRTFAGPFRFLTEVSPTVRVPGTDVLLGPGRRFPQGSPRTSGVYSRPLLSSTGQRVSAVLRSFGIPGPSAEIEEARRQAREQARLGARSLRRRQQERRLSRIGR